MVTFANMMTCSGMDASFMGQCSMSWVGLVLAVFIIMIARKWIFEEMLQQEFAFYIGIAGTVIVYYFSFGIFGAYKIATVIGIVGGLAAGYFGPMFMGGGGGEDGGSNEF